MTDSNLALVKVGINVVAEEGLPYQIEETKGKKLRIDILIASITLAACALSVQLWEDVAPRAFSYAQLEQATSGFKEELGRGAFGTVIKGIFGGRPESGELGKLVSDEEVDRRQFERMVKLSIWCIQDEPSLRSSMKKVLRMLEGTVEIPVPPSPPTSFPSSI
ncbi:hypothetical protein RND71_014774 [Anisodus tanguticus]|uniref:Uncharacterized protein n=1 Tax=Anisodus tanguticus TaxID=243964 RepID=A0AAE1VN20_9SOLA|nr:hypothetical protein RND71_014774 [Anisodus tanguticus]